MYESAYGPFAAARDSRANEQCDSGATVVRSLSPKTAVTMLKSEGGWSLIASRSAISRRGTLRRCSDLADTGEKVEIERLRKFREGRFLFPPLQASVEQILQRELSTQSIRSRDFSVNGRT
jgi:hypothetical protein